MTLTETMQMEDVVTEIWYLMANFLDDRSLIMFCLCGKKWNLLFSDLAFWKNRLVSTFGSNLPILPADSLNPRKYYGWLISNQMVRVGDCSQRFNQTYDQLLNHYLTLEKSQEFGGYTKFFCDLINSPKDINISKKDLAIHLTIFGLTHFEEIETVPFIKLITEKDRGCQLIELIKTQNENKEISLLVAISSLSLEDLYSYSFTE